MSHHIGPMPDITDILREVKRSETKTIAAARLGISRSTLEKKLKEHESVGIPNTDVSKMKIDELKEEIEWLKGEICLRRLRPILEQFFPEVYGL